MMILRMIALVFLLSMSLLAQVPPRIDPGLTAVGMGDTFTDQQGDSLVLIACRTKYKEPVVGMYFHGKDGTDVRYYMNAAAWDRMKQTLIKARDQWATLSMDTFKTWQAVPGYRVANRVAKVTFSLMGATDLATKQLLISCDGGAASPKRVVINLGLDDVKALVEQLYKVDDFLRQ